MARKQNLGVVYALAWSFHKTSRIDFNELFQEAALAYYEGKKAHKKDKGKEITFIYRVIANRLINFIHDEMRYHLLFPDNSEMVDHPVEYKLFFDFYNSLSPDSQQITRILLDNKEQILLHGNWKARGIIRDKLKQQGDSEWKARKKIKQLKSDLQKV